MMEPLLNNYLVIDPLSPALSEQCIGYCIATAVDMISDCNDLQWPTSAAE